PGASAAVSAARRSKSFLPKAGAAGCVEAGVTQKARRSMAEERNLSMWGAQRRCLFVFENSLHRIIAYLVGNLFPDGKVLGEGGQGRVALDKPMARYLTSPPLRIVCARSHSGFSTRARVGSR